MTSIANIIVNNSNPTELKQDFDLIGNSLTVNALNVSNVNTIGDYSIDNIPVFQLDHNVNPSNVLVGGNNADLQNNSVLGTNNTSLGFLSLQNLTSANNNTAVGFSSMNELTTGNNNTSVGYRSLNNNIIGTNNTSIGYRSLNSNLANNNTSIGYNSGYNNTIGINNVCIGSEAGQEITTGNNNIIIGTSAGQGLTTGNNNIIIGSGSSNLNSNNTLFLGNVLTSSVVFAGIAMVPGIATPNNANAATAGVPIGGLYRSLADPSLIYIRSA